MKQVLKPETGREAPLVSVCMPAHNAQCTIREAVESVLNQDVPLELLIVEDCSTDGTLAAVREFEKDPRVRVLVNSENLGAAKSRNKAVRSAAGKYVAFLDADDRWAAGKLKRQLEKIRETGDVLCCTGRELMRPDGTLTGRVIGVPEVITYRRELRDNCINCSSVLLLREAALKFPMEHEDSHEDYIAWMKLLRRYRRACGINEPLLQYRLSSGGKSGTKLRSAAMTYHAYRYAGFGPVRSALLFCRYAVRGVLKYLRAFLRVG